jgi:hypothetical protein
LHGRSERLKKEQEEEAKEVTHETNDWGITLESSEDQQEV